jgi:hypothetical protein
VPGVTQDIGAGIDNSIACVSASRCYAAVSSSSGDEIDVINNGAITKTITMANAPLVIACYQAATCFVAAYGDGMPFLYSMSPTTGTLGKAQEVTGMSQVNGLACASATECVAVGYAGSPIHSATSEIANGKPHAVKTAPGIALSGVACSTATTCWAIGQNTNGVGIVDGVTLP